MLMEAYKENMGYFIRRKTHKEVTRFPETSLGLQKMPYH